MSNVIRLGGTESYAGEGGHVHTNGIVVKAKTHDVSVPDVMSGSIMALAMTNFDGMVIAAHIVVGGVNGAR